MQREYKQFFESTSSLTPKQKEEDKYKTIARLKAERDTYWNTLLYNMANGSATDIDALNALDIFDFYSHLQIWEKKMNDQLHVTEKPVAKHRTTRR